jgi:hypothetical protein
MERIGERTYKPTRSGFEDVFELHENAQGGTREDKKALAMTTSSKTLSLEWMRSRASKTQTGGHGSEGHLCSFGAGQLENRDKQQEMG